MPGETTTGSLADAMPEIVADARIVREFEGTFMRTCDVKKQKANTGLNWTEFALDQLNKQEITETTDNRNFQQMSGTLLSVEPQMSQIIVKVTDRTYRKIAAVVKEKFGTLAGNAMKRGKDEDYLAMFATFATTNSPGTGTPISFGHVSGAVANCESNLNEPAESEIFSILHGRHVYDLQAELTAGVGTYTVPEGISAETYRKGFEGTVAGSNVFKDGNIAVDSVPDANGATHAREGVVLALGMEIKTEPDRDIYFGGGADVISMTDEYAYVERSTGNWCYLHKADATAPTS